MVNFTYLPQIDLPVRIQEICDPPKGLYLLGPRDLLDQPNLGVVGAREMQLSSKSWMENELSTFLERNRRLVISGGARGVDQRAHALALRHGLPTIVVLPCGFERLYPKDLKEWIDHPDVLFISEYPPEQEMRRHHFYRRNRLIAGLSDHLLIVEAKEKSGTIITARYAIEQGVDVLVPPGSVCNPNFSGNNQLLFDGAQMIRDARDMLELIPVFSQQQHTSGKQDDGGEPGGQ